MQYRTEYKGEQLCHIFWPPMSLQRLQIDMPIQEVMHWFIPKAVELLIGRGIPPVIIELPIGKASELRKHVGNVFEHYIEQDDFDHEEG